jgi:hypothetical protein
MPKYTNAGTVVQTMGDVRVEPGQTVKTLQFIPGVLPTGITEVVTAPTILPVLSSAKITGPTTVTIPEVMTNPLSEATEALNGNYKITVYVAVGDATVQLNGVGVARYVGLYETYTITCLSRTIDSLVVTPSGTTNVTVELI